MEGMSQKQDLGKLVQAVELLEISWLSMNTSILV